MTTNQIMHINNAERWFFYTRIPFNAFPSETAQPNTELLKWNKNINFYQRDVVSVVYATETWLGGWLAGCLWRTDTQPKRLNLS